MRLIAQAGVLTLLFSSTKARTIHPRLLAPIALVVARLQLAFALKLGATALAGVFSARGKPLSTTNVCTRRKLT
jgi:hypothetical protein